MVYAAAVCRVRTVFIVFLPIYWGFAKYPSVKTCCFWLPVWAGSTILAPYLRQSSSFIPPACTFWANCSVPIAKVRAALTGVRHCRLDYRFGLFQIFRFFPSADCTICRKRRRNRHPDAAGAFLLYLPVCRLSGLLLPRPARRAFWVARAAAAPEFFPTVTSYSIIRAAAFKSTDGEQAGALAQIRTRRPRSPVRPPSPFP